MSKSPIYGVASNRFVSKNGYWFGEDNNHATAVRITAGVGVLYLTTPESTVEVGTHVNITTPALTYGRWGTTYVSITDHEMRINTTYCFISSPEPVEFMDTTKFSGKKTAISSLQQNRHHIINPTGSLTPYSYRHLCGQCPHIAPCRNRSSPGMARIASHHSRRCPAPRASFHAARPGEPSANSIPPHPLGTGWQLAGPHLFAGVAGRIQAQPPTNRSPLCPEAGCGYPGAQSCNSQHPDSARSGLWHSQHP